MLLRSDRVVPLLLVLAGCGGDEPAGPSGPNGPAAPAEAGGLERVGDEPAAPRDEPTSAGPAAAPADAPSGSAGPGADVRLRFTDQAAAAGLDAINWCGPERDRKPTIHESLGQGAAWLDDDGDGLLDLFVVNGSTTGAVPDPPPVDHYYRNLGDGRFEEIGAELGLADPAWGNGVAAADADGDGDTDLYVTTWGPHRLHVKGADGRYTDVAAAAGVDCVRASGPPLWGAGAAWGDVDLDGDLDLYVCHYLEFDPEDPPNEGRTRNWKGIRDAFYGPPGCVPQPDFLFRNEGDGTFTDATASSGVGAVPAAFALVPVFADLDLDGDPDLYVANDTDRNYLFRNDGGGRFTESGALIGVAFGEQGNEQAGMGVAAEDFDRDGDDDLFVTNFDDDVNTLYRNDGRTFRDVTVAMGMAAPSRNDLSWGCALVDLDNDADLDAFFASGHVYPRAETDDPLTSYRQRNRLLQQRVVDGKLRFVDVTDEGGPAMQLRKVSRGAAFGDYDADGDVDVFVVDLNETPTLYRNDTEGGRWLEVRLEGRGANTGGIGARVTVRSGDLELSAERRAGGSYLSTGSPWMHFGLGERAHVDEVRVRWPSGRESRHGPFDLGALDDAGEPSPAGGAPAPARRGARVTLAEPR